MHKSRKSKSKKIEKAPKKLSIKLGKIKTRLEDDDQ